MLTIDSQRKLITTAVDDESRFTKTISEETQGPMLKKFSNNELRFRDDVDDNFTKMTHLKRKKTSGKKTKESE